MKNKFHKPPRKIPLQRKSDGVVTLPEMIGTSADKYGDLPSLLAIGKSGIEEMSYFEALTGVSKIGRHLKELGIEKGDHIGILGENSPQWALAYFAVSWIGAVSIPLDPQAAPDDLRFILSFTETKALFVSHSVYSKLGTYLEDLPYLKHTLILENTDEIQSKYAHGIGAEKIDLDDTLEILFTSGTTGNPKGVMLSHRNIMSNIDDMYRLLETNSSDRALSILPIHHVYECTGGLLNSFNNGMSVYFGRGLNPRFMVEDMKTAKPTVWLTAPLILEKLYMRIAKELNQGSFLTRAAAKLVPGKILGSKVKEKLGLANVRYIISGGAALPEWVSEGLERLGFPILQGYGLSETSPLVTLNPPENPKSQSAGMVIPSVDVEIRDVDEDGNGEIAVKGPNVMKGYYQNDEATHEVLSNDGWFRTGDIGYFDEEGYLYITGRKKYVIVTKGGKNVFPEEIEEKLCKSPIIEEAMVFSPDDVSIQAVIYPNEEELNLRLDKLGMLMDDDSIWNAVTEEIKKVNKQLQAYKKINRYAIRRSEFSKTSSRKIKRNFFKELSLRSAQRFIEDT